MKNKTIRKKISCGILPVYVHKDGKREFLLVHQHNDNWSIPKGHIEEGETFLETAKRELFEETGLVCSSIIEDKVFTDSYIIRKPNESFHKTVYYFIGYVNDQNLTLQEEEIQGYLWGTEEEILERMTFKEQKESFKKMVDFLKK